MKSNYKYLLKNVGILAVGNFTSKLLSFFLIPLYTAVLTTAEYGSYDLLNTTIGLVVPIFTLNVLEGIFRFALDKENDKSDLVKIGLKHYALSFLPLFLLALISFCFNLSPNFNRYLVFFVLMYSFNALSGILSSIAKGLKKLRVIAIAGAISSAIMIVLNLLFLLVFKWGLNGYFIANIAGSAVQCLYIMFAISIWKYIKITAEKNESAKTLEKSVLNYSKPLIANSVSWWINNVSDRYVVILFCGIAVNGIYSIAYKLPTFLNVIVSIFNQAWGLSAINEFDDKDKNHFFSKTYAIYNCLIVLISSAMIVTNKMIARLLYANDFYAAWQYVPFLLIAFMFGALSGYIGGIFAAVKRSKIYAKSTVAGAIVNIVLNIVLVLWLGAMGAAIATTISYIVVWVIRLYHMRKFIAMEIDFRCHISVYLIMLIQALLMLIINSTVYMYLVEFLLFGMIVFLLRKDIVMLYFSIFSKVRR